MQLVFCRRCPDSLADRGADRAGNPYDNFAWRQFAGRGGDALRLLLSRAVNTSFGTDPLDRLHSEVERDAAGNRFVGNDEILRANAEDASFIEAGIAGQLRFEF